MHDLQGTPVITGHISAHIALVTTPELRVGYVLEILGSYTDPAFLDSSCPYACIGLGWTKVR